MSEIASAYVSVLPSAKGFGSKLNSEIGGDLNSAGKSAGGKFGSAMKIGALAVLGGAALAAGFLKGAIGEAREAQKVGALTTQIIKSTGNAAGITADQVGAMAGRLSSFTGIDDEAIQSGANMLLTFKNVRNYVDGEFVGTFDRATAAAVDLSAAGFGSITGASKTLGKALNDPIKGVAALGRSGVTFTEEQKALIGTLVETGRSAEAQALILKEVESQVGGAAAASATYGEKASVAFGNVKEQIGTNLLPVVDGFFKMFLSTVPTITRLVDGIGPAFTRVQAFLAPFVTQIQGLFGGGAGGGLMAGIQSFIATVQANFLPVLQTMAATFTTKVLPAITSLASYVVAKLVPIFRQVASIITGQVLPIAGRLAQFFYGTLYPAIIAIVGAVAKNLKPVFDQLVATFRGSVLPTVQKLLAKFEEYRPTIQKVITQVVAVAGAVLKFAAAILGKVLPVVIRFAGFLIANVVPAIASVIGVVIKIISKVFDFGEALVGGIKAAAKFATGVGEKITLVLTRIGELPGKVLDILSGLATKMYSAGVQLVTQLANGIRDKIEDAVSAMRAGVDRLKGLLPGSPIKWGPLKSWNNGGAGKRLMELVARGITAATPKTIKAAQTAFGKIGDALESERDRLSGVLDGFKSDFASLADSVKGAFTGNLFDATTGSGFVANLTKKKGELTGLLSSFATLKGFGIDPAFLSQLFASGNGALITEIAGMSQSGAVGAANLFADVNTLGTQLGGAVAANDPVASRIDETNRQLQKTNKQLAYLADDIGKALNGAAAKAQRDKKNRTSR